MKYPKTYIEEIKNRLKVSDVVRLKVNLKKRGKEYVGLSPFKKEKTPSFTVNDDKGFYHCFSTGEHGNIFDFLMKLENINFGDAVRSLAQRAGMQPYRFTKQDEIQEKQNQNVQQIFQIYFSECKNLILTKYKDSHLKHLFERGLKKETIDFFEIGFCENSKEIQEKLFQQGFKAEDLIETGLFYKLDGSQEIVNRFKNRIIFPIKNYYGSFIGCGGRTVLDNALAKYINSPETKFFKKGFNLFNLNNSKKENLTNDNLIIVEGYMDAISLYNHDIKNVVASLGTAITPGQINLAWKNFNNLIICFDGDQSGQDAMYRAAERILKIIKPGKDAFFLSLPNKQDPDDFVKQFGKQGFASLINQRKNLVDIIFEHYSLDTDSSKASDIALLEKKLFSICNEMEDQISKKYFISSFKEKIFTNLIRKKSKNINSSNEIKSASLRLLLNKEELLELSLFNLILEYPLFSASKIEELSNMQFSSLNINSFIAEYIDCVLNDKLKDKESLHEKININFSNILNKIEKYANNKQIIKNLDKERFYIFFDDYITELKNIKKNNEAISLAEKEILENPNESSFEKLVNLKK